MVPLIRYANVNGAPVMELLERKYGDANKAKEVMDAIVERTRKAGGEVVGLLKTGSAFYSPASAAIAMTEALLKDQKRLLPVCAFLEGEYNVNDMYLGVPAIIGGDGVENVVELSLNEEEGKMLDDSVNAVKKLLEDMKRLGFL